MQIHKDSATQKCNSAAARVTETERERGVGQRCIVNHFLLTWTDNTKEANSTASLI